MSTTCPAPTLTLTVNRVFNASRERVYAAWTEPDQFQRWWGPPGTVIPFVEMDVRVAIAWLWCRQGWT
ncbi:MAG: SRPBCC domain-containing protein [Chloroflexi bacterium]|nr:SRPBCC domain-containing protein [Chloroflexota bacterium]